MEKKSVKYLDPSEQRALDRTFCDRIFRRKSSRVVFSAKERKKIFLEFLVPGAWADK